MGLCRRLAKWAKRLEQMPVGGDEREIQRLIREAQSVHRATELDMTTKELVEFLVTGSAGMRAKHSRRTDVAADGLAQRFDDHCELKFDDLRKAVSRYPDV